MPTVGNALMGKLAPGRFRDGEIKNVLADLHVPDMVCVRLGDVIPTDFKFMEGNATKVDRSSLTGESLSVIQSEGDEGYSGSGLKQGEIETVMTSTGLNTFLGHAAEKIASGRPPCTAVCRWCCQRWAASAWCRSVSGAW
ncbi:P-type ATPase, A domain [Phytophthora cactorum]|nr:P-type ATPase, A domain [Phytophthora cactorum]